MTHKITFLSNPRQEEIEILDNGIIADAILQKGHEKIQRFGFFIRDDNNKILGGCDGEIWCGCLYINHLWVSNALRGKGYGSKLMLSAENLAWEKGCTFVAANTMDLAVVDFYKRLGYYVEFERPGYLKDSVLYYMRRNLAAP